MVVNEPIDPRVRLTISQWPDDAPRGAVSTFCVEHGTSRKSFYELRKRALADRPAAVLEPRSERSASSPSMLNDEVKKQAAQVRAALEASGLDCGPISVHDKMHAMGLPVVSSTAASSRIFRGAGVARLEPKKKPRGVEAITCKPSKPTTQGKNERFHQTLFRYLDKQPLIPTLAELQAQVDAFDHIYNPQRPHEALRWPRGRRPHRPIR